MDELGEMKNDLSEEATLEEWKEVLENVGDFSAELYFSLKNPSTFDAEKYFYKHRILVDRYEAGVVLYRNAFSISSYEGKKDWLGFGKGLESLQQRPVTLQAHGVFVKIKCQVKLLLIKRKIKDYLI